MLITVHFVDENFEMYDRTLHVEPIHDSSHISIFVLEEDKEGFIIFGSQQFESDQFIIVSYSASNKCGVEGISATYQ